MREWTVSGEDKSPRAEKDRSKKDEEASAEWTMSRGDKANMGLNSFMSTTWFKSLLQRRN